MAWKEISKEGLAFLGSLVLQIYALITKPETDWLTKILVCFLFLVLVVIVMYTPEKVKK